MAPRSRRSAKNWLPENGLPDGLPAKRAPGDARRYCRGMARSSRALQRAGHTKRGILATAGLALSALGLVASAASAGASAPAQVTQPVRAPSLLLSTRQLDMAASGGVVEVRFEVDYGTTCALSAQPEVPGWARSFPCRHASVLREALIPANPSPSPRRYVLWVSVSNPTATLERGEVVQQAGAEASAAIGNDVSYPQCGGSLPPHPAFGVVGVNGGLANDLNPCFGPSPSYKSYGQSELYWAVASSVGGTDQPKASLYVNTGDPGDVYDGTLIADWPSSGSTPYGPCLTTTLVLGGSAHAVGQDSAACAWQYGYEKATSDATWLSEAAKAIDGQSPPLGVSASAGSYPWWLDVETANTWQSDPTTNVADLQGMVAGLEAAGATTIGVYSTASQWDAITGGTGPSSGSLHEIPVWIAGARDLAGAQANCARPSFTGGPVELAEWLGYPVDGDYAC